jgi:glycosyl hydrolase family 20
MIQISFKTIGFNPNTQYPIAQKLSPLPQKKISTKGSVIFDPKVKITLKGNSMPYEELPPALKGLNINFMIDPDWNLEDFAQKVIGWLNLRLGELKSDFEFSSDTLKILPGEFTTVISEDLVPKSRWREGYYLNVSEKGIIINSWTFRGAYYAILSIMQMMTLEKIDKDILPVCHFVEMWDYPEYAIRGLVDDISRGQRPTMDNFKFFIQFLSRSKQNFFVLYIEDIFTWEKHPKIGQGRGPLTKKDVREIQDYAKEWLMTVIPGVELLGHMDNMLTDPDYMQYAEFPGAQCLDISNPDSKVFVRELLEEIAPVFDTPLFAPICDESFDFGLRNSAGLVKEKGWDRALADWYLFLIEEIRKVGKEVVLFAHDILQQSKEVLRAIQKENAVVYYWDYSDKKKYPKIDKLKKEGLTVAGGPAVFDWSRHYPYFDFAEKNMINMAQDGLKRGIIGLITTKWGDFFNENFRNNIFYGLAVNGQAAWSPMKSDVPQIRKAYIWNFFGSTDDRIIECMDTLSNQNVDLPRWPNGMFNRFWLDPFVRKIKSKEYEMAKQFILDAAKIIKKVDLIREKPTITCNDYNFNYMLYSAKMARHFGVKILISEASFHSMPELAKFAVEKIGHDLSQPQTNLVKGFKWLLDDIRSLKKEYQVLWRNLALEEGLEYPSQRFDVLAWHYEKAIEDLENGIKPHAHQLQSEWIWISGRRTNVEWGNGKFYYFTKDVRLQKPVKKATLQGIANNHIKIYANGTYLGQVLSRFSLSQFPMAKSVQWFDVTDNIVNDEIVLCIEGANWAYGVGGMNVMLHLEYNDGTTDDILSNPTWSYLEDKPKGWPFDSISKKNSISWKKVRSFGKPPGAWMGAITEPVWEKGWKSSISFIFGNRNFIDTALNTQLGRTLYRYLFWLVPAGGHFFSEDMYNLRE